MSAVVSFSPGRTTVYLGQSICKDPSRCLQTKSPVESSRQSLIEIFEDIRKRWEISEKKRLEERAQRKKEADSERDRMHLIKGKKIF